ncbi:uncharacterized protein LOC125676746 isoform X2 [Ostrea edulis]|uniref:uncharacterized protein LOC125676746 isoform X2 n=1 Tax=Ostrea edulis TaxID=37623 RepID=UPI0024AFED5E|nr:uncharacterized protein LOC125676746 isoform X2 [Ostrea edulis]
MADDVDVDSGIEEELEVLKSIYIDELNLKTSESGWPELISLQLHPSTGDEVEKKYVCITLELQPTQMYPHDIPSIDIKYPRGIGEEEVNRLQTSLMTLATELQGGPMLYDLIELAKESLTEGNVPHCPCTICYEHFHKGEEFTKTTCYHYFHCQCLSRYIKHVLENIEQENQSCPTHLKRDDKQTKAPCPVCREEIDCNLDIVTREITTEDQMQAFVPTAEMKKWQKEMSGLLNRQREKGGVIDMEEEKNKFLITQDDVVEIGSITNKSQGREFPITKDTDTSDKNKVSMKSKSMKETVFKANRLAVKIQKLEKENEKRQSGFSEEFEALSKMETSNGSKKEGQRPENRNKNRIKHLVPYDNTRVVLRDGDPEMKGSDYICASYIEVGSHSTHVEGGLVIATQGCVPETVGDFWRMIWQENSKVIVMASKEREDNRVKVARYWCEPENEKILQGENYKFLVKGKAASTHKDYILRQMEVSKYSTNDQAIPGVSQVEGTRLVYQYNYTAWPDFGVPRNLSSIIDFLETVNLKQESLSETGPMVIHCSAGIGRTGTLVVIETLIFQIKEEGLDCNLDIQKTLLKVRSQRPGMVQTEAQYRFIYKAVLCYLQSQPGYAPDQTNEKGSEASTNKVYREEPDERFVRRNLRGRGRGKHFGWRNESNKSYSQREGETYSHRMKKGDVRSHGEIKQPRDKKNSEHQMEKYGGEKVTERNQGRREPQSSKRLEADRSENNQTDNSEGNNHASKRLEADRSENSHTDNSEGNNHGSASKSPAERPKQGFGRPKSAKTNKSFQETEKQQSSKEVRVPYQEELPETESKESGKHGENRKGFERPKSHRETKKEESSRKGQSRPNQDSYSESEDKESATRRENRKDFGKPTIKDTSDTVKNNAEKSVRKENSRRGFGQPPKGMERNSKSERPLSGGRWGEERSEDRERRGRWSAKRQTPKGDTRDNRNITNQERRYDRKPTPKVKDSRPRLSPERLCVKDSEIAKSENGRGKCDKDTGPRVSSSGTASDQERRPRTPPGFHLSGPPPGLGAHIRPPPGFSECS